MTTEQQNFIQLVSAYVQLQESRKSLKGNCPFHHDNTQSFMVNPDKLIYKCFGCGAEGGVKEFSDAISRQH